MATLGNIMYRAFKEIHKCTPKEHCKECAEKSDDFKESMDLNWHYNADKKCLDYRTDLNTSNPPSQYPAELDIMCEIIAYDKDGNLVIDLDGIKRVLENYPSGRKE